MTTYTVFVALQFTIYEKIIQYYKRKYSKDKFLEREFWINCWAGFLGGSIGASLTNAFEAVTVAK